MNFHIYNDTDGLFNGIALWIAGNINLVLKTKERYSFCLSGGNTPKRLYEILAKDYSKSIDWSRVDFFWGDERYVPFTDSRSNAGMASDCLLDPLNIAEKNIFQIETGDFAASEALKYEGLLKHYFGDSPVTFDFVLLGMGKDAHTLSLFPGADLVTHQKGWVSEAYNATERLKRITLLPSVVNKSAFVTFLIQGEDKADALEHVVKGERNPQLYPAQLISPANGNLQWFMDKPAVQKLAPGFLQ